MEAFQEIDQLAVFKPVTKWAARIYDRQAHPRRGRHRLPRGGRPGARGRSTSTCPATSSARRSRRNAVTYAAAWKPAPRTLGDPAAVKEAIALLAKAERR